MTLSRRRSCSAAAGLLGLLAALCISPAMAGVTAVLSPATQQVAPGGVFDLTLNITPAGSPFNAFDSRIAFDPAALTPVTLSPLNSQIGPLFTSVCSNFFHRFSAGATEDTAGCSMLCANTSVSGPGTLYRLRFQASNTVQTTVVRFSQLRFYQGGLFVLPVTAGEAVIGIGQPITDAGAPARGALSMTVAPSPVRTQARFEIELPHAGRVRVDVLDLQGRLVRTLLDEQRPAGHASLSWNETDGGGARLAPGAYFARAAAGGEVSLIKLVVVR